MYKYRAFIGDIHGSIEALHSALSKIDLKSTEIYFVGDYVDRGKDSKLVLDELKHLNENNENIHCILGNHDKMFIDFVYLGDNLGFLNDPNLNTLKSFFTNDLNFDGMYDVYDGNYNKVTKNLRHELSLNPILPWLISLPKYIETENQIITHAGVDKSLTNWKETSDLDFMWIRPNLQIPNNTGKDIIVGHTMTYKFKDAGLNQPDIYVSELTNEYFIDTANYQYGNARVLLYDIEKDSYIEIK